jgi:hypothetical protein
LFTGKKAGLLGTAFFYGLDSMQVEHKGLDLATDALLGVGKGVSTKAVFSMVGKLEAAPSIKGMVMGSTSRLVDQACIYMDFPSNKHYGLPRRGIFRSLRSLPSLWLSASLSPFCRGI